MVYRQTSQRQLLVTKGQARQRAARVGRGMLGAGVTLLSLGLVGCKKGEVTDNTETRTDDPTSAETSATQQTTSRSQPSIDTKYDTAPLFTAQPPALSATIEDEPTKPDVSDAPLQTCVPASGPGQNLLIDDFEDEDLDLPQHEARLGQWYLYEEVSGDHQLAISELTSPRLQSHWAAHTSATDHGSWAGFGVQLSDCVYDASGYVGLHFWVRGSSNPINVAILTPGVVPAENGGTCIEEEGSGCWDAYRQEVEVTDEWQEHFLPFSDFEQGGYGQDAGVLDLTRVRTVEFQSNEGAFDLWVDDFSFYIEEVYTPLDPSTDDSGSTSGDTASDSSEPTEDVDGGETSQASATSNVTTEESEDTEPSDDGGVQ